MINVSIPCTIVAPKYQKGVHKRKEQKSQLRAELYDVNLLNRKLQLQLQVRVRETVIRV